MVILGLILVLIALAMGAALIMGTSSPDVAAQDIDVSFFDTVTITLDPLTLVVAGMVAMFVLWLGLVLIKTTLARKARARKLRKQEEAAARERLIERDGYYDDRGYGEAPRRDAGRGRPELAEESPRLAEQPPRAEETTRIPRRESADPGATRPIGRDEGATGRVHPEDGDATRAVHPDDATRPIRRDERPDA